MAVVSMAQALQSIVSRNLPPMEQLVISVTQVHGGTVDNVIPETAWLEATIRSFTPDVRDMVEKRVHEVISGLAAAFDVSADVIYDRGYPATVNHPEQTEVALEVARDLSGAARVDGNGGVSMGAEDFAYMLEERPGAYLFLGQGEGPYVHHPEYDFNDEVSPYGASFFAKLVERINPAT